MKTGSELVNESLLIFVFILKRSNELTLINYHRKLDKLETFLVIE